MRIKELIRLYFNNINLNVNITDADKESANNIIFEFSKAAITRKFGDRGTQVGLNITPECLDKTLYTLVEISNYFEKPQNSKIYFDCTIENDTIVKITMYTTLFKYEAD
jgi:hypothetical protein